MNGYVKSARFPQPMGPATTLLSLLLVMAVDSVAVRRNQQCVNPLRQSLKLTRLLYNETVDLIKTYKAAQGEQSDLLCSVSVSDIPDARISGLEPSERIVSIYAHLQAFLPHFKRVYEQQTDLQLPGSQLLSELTTVYDRSRHLAVVVNGLYQSLFPNLPPPEPAGRPTALPPPQNVFQQKVYGCAVVKKYKEFLSNVLRTLRGQVRRRRIAVNSIFIF